MEIKKAIESLDYIKYCNDYKGCRESIAIEMAKDALKKQIPKKVDIPKWSPAKCPSCGRELSVSLGDGYYQHPTFLEVCPNVECCQRLKW